MLYYVFSGPLSLRAYVPEIKFNNNLSYNLSYVCLSGDVRRMQLVSLAQSPREMSQTDRNHPRYILSRVRVSIRPIILLYAKKPHPTVARPAAVDRRAVADKQLNLNGRNRFSRRSSVPRDQRENVVAECSDHGSNPVQGTIFFFHFYCLRLTRLTFNKS